MAIFKDVFSKGKQEESVPAPEVPEPMSDPLGGPVMNPPDASDLPVDHVITMRNQGMSNNQIIQNLQRYGYAIDQINNAINQADIKLGVHTPFGPGPGSTPPVPGGTAPHEPPPGGMAPHGEPPMAGPHGAGLGPGPGPESTEPTLATGIPSASEEKMHEIAESIIEEKWGEITDHIEKIITWKDSTEQKLAKIEQDIAHLTGSFDKLHEGVLGKVGEYDKNLETIGTEIKALEKVFQKVLPGFVDNVQELSRITRRVKQDKGVK